MPYHRAFGAPHLKAFECRQHEFGIVCIVCGITVIGGIRVVAVVLHDYHL